jgi:hypothetical protein
VRVTTALCATRRHVVERRCKGSAGGLSQQPGEAGGSLILGAQGRAGAAPTTARRAGTTRRSSARSARRKGATEVNQWWNPLKRDAGSNLVDVGRRAAHAVRDGGGRRLRSRPNAVGGEATTKDCGVLVAMLQGKSWAPTPSIETW